MISTEPKAARQSIIRGLLVFGFGVWPLALVRGETSGVVLRNLDQPGSFEIATSGKEVALRSDVGVEQLEKGTWHSVSVQYLLLREKCNEEEPASCIPLGSDFVFHPVPWTGDSCLSQCPAGCVQNAYLGPGTFRFVLTPCGPGKKIYGSPFVLPSHPAPSGPIQTPQK